MHVTKEFAKLYHVGDLHVDKKHHGGFSYEGPGLSVSEVPQSWKVIAKLSGKTWQLTKPGNRFLDWYQLSESAKNSVFEWAKAEGWATEVPVWELTWYDDELEDTVCSFFLSEESAEAERDDEGEIKETVGLGATPKLTEFSGYRGGLLPLAYVRDMVAMAYAQAQGLDGVYWNEMQDELRLSAPRAAILPHNLPTWSISKADAS